MPASKCVQVVEQFSRAQFPGTRRAQVAEAAPKVAFTYIERARCERALETFLERRRPPAHLRDRVDLAYRIEGHSVVIFEIRPRWDDPTQKHEIPVARATFVRTRSHWRVFWMRRDLKWHGYEPAPTVRDIEAFVALVDRDAHACFFG